MRSQLDVSERRACTVVGQPRATQRRHLKTPDDEAALTAAIVRLATRYGRVKTLYIEPGSPWENGYCESLNSKLRDELLNGEIFTTMREAQVLIENWRRHYNAIRPHSSLGYRPPAPEAILPPAPVCPTLRFGQPKRWPKTAGF